MDFYTIDQEEPSEEFKRAWQAAKDHIKSKCRDGLAWLRLDLHLPMDEHLAFAIGNQVFFVYVEAAEFNFLYTHKLFMDAALLANAIPCVMTMEKSFVSYKPINQGWGLIDPRDNTLIDPLLLVTDELIEMSDWDLHDFAIQIVVKHLRDAGKKIGGTQSSAQIDPSIYFEENGHAYCVIVRAARYPSRAALRPDNIRKSAEFHSNKAKAVFFASVVFANINDPFDPDARPNGNYWPIYRGHGVNIKFLGLENI
jgi:hypothetical protein